MAKISREFHDRCLAAIKTIKARDPVLAEQAMARGVPLTRGTPVHDLMLDLIALEDAASSFATGLSARAAQTKRAQALISQTLG
jgi:hypothetical protein